MWPIVRQARYLGRYRDITQVLVSHGFGYLAEQLGLLPLLSFPRRLVFRSPPSPRLGTAVRLREMLIALGPTFVKLGQLLSTRPDLLPAEYIVELSKLQDTVPPFPEELAVATVETELGKPLDALFLHFERQPFAAASLGQVHAAVLNTGEQVVVKVQRPDIAQRVQNDLAIVAELAELAQERLAIGKQYDLVELAAEFSATLRSELDYRNEAHNADRFRHNFTGSSIVHIPTVYWEYTSARVLTTERIFGLKINDIAGMETQGIDRKRLARHSMQLILEEIFTFGFFHGDPHPGNFFALPGEVIGAVDFGQVGSLDPATTRGLVFLLTALSNRNSAGMVRALEQLGALSRLQNTPALRRDIYRFTERFVDRPLADLSARETIEALIALLQRHQISLPGPLATLLKSLVMMEGVGMQLDPDLDVFGIARPYAQRVMLEQIAPSELKERLLEGGRVLSETAILVPQQVSDVLERLNNGELVVQTRETELRRLGGAIIGAANRLALAIVLAALLLAISVLSISISLGDWQGWLPTTLLVLGIAGAMFLGLLLALALVRGSE
jgi:ubiquinone biosynthesis protein